MEIPGEKLIIRMWETLAEKGIGGLLRPWQTRREGYAQIDVKKRAILEFAQAEKDMQEIQEGRKSLYNGKLISLPLYLQPDNLSPDGRVEPQALSPILQQITNSHLIELGRREINVGKAILHAEATLQDGPQTAPEKEIQSDWLYRWRDYASSVSSDELHIMWGNLLAGEIKSPGTFSLRVLSLIHNISTDEAIKIAALSRFIIDDIIFRGARDILEKEGITVDFLLDMQALGIVTGVTSVGLTIKWDLVSDVTFLPSHDRGLLVRGNGLSKNFSLSVYPLTTVGREILRLGKFQRHDSYLKEVGRAIKDQGFEVALATCTGVIEGQTVFNNIEKL